MAVTLGQAVLYLTGNSQGLDKTLDEAEQGTKSWASNLGSNVNKLVGGALLAGGTAVVAGIAAVGGVAISTANEVQVAQGKIQSQLRLTDDQAVLFGDTIKRVYGNNFGDSIEDVGTALTTTAQELGRVGVTAQEELGKATESAIALRDAFEVEVGESTNAAAALMDNLGLSSEEAFDFIASGLQDSRISNEDFLDSIREYSNLFGDAGFSAEQMYSIMATGTESGVLGTDKIADAIKEFGIIMNEQTDASKEAIRDMGLPYDEWAEKVSSGEGDWADYFDQIVGGLNQIDDPMERAKAQTAIFGTMAEDLGVSFTESLSSSAVKTEELAGATDALNAQYNNFGSFLEGFKRRGALALEPLGRVALQLANQAMPFLESVMNRVTAAIDTYLAPAIEDVGRFVNGFIVEIQNGLDPIQAIIEAFLNWTNAGENLSEEAFNIVIQIADLWEQIKEGAAPIIELITQFVSWKDIMIVLGGFIVATIVPIIAGLVASILTIAAPIIAIIAVVALLRNAWDNNWGGIRDKVEAVINFIKPFIENAINAIRQFWAQNGDQILAKTRAAFDAIRLKITEVMTAIKERIDFYLALVTTIWEAFRAAFEGDWTEFGTKLREAWDMIWNDVKTRFLTAKDNLIQAGKDLVEGIRTKFTEIDWGELGWQIVNGIAGAITAGAGAIAEAARNAAAAALDAAKAFLGIESPSKEAGDQVGDPFVVGIADRIRAGIQKLRDAAVFTVKGALTGAASAATSGAAPASTRPLTPAYAAAGGGNTYDIKIIVPNANATAQDIAKEVQKVIDKIAKRTNNRRRL